MQESTLLNKCLVLIEEKAKWGPHSGWTNYHFTRLSEQLSEETGIYISVSTVKRLFKNNPSKKLYKPQLETKNALSIYLGFKNWNDFENHYKEELFSEGNTQKGNTKDNSFQKADTELRKLNNNTDHIRVSKKENRSILLIAGCLIIAFILFIIYLFIISTNKFYIHWNAQKAVAPITASFRYKIPNWGSGNYYIDFGDDQRIVLPKDKESISHFYKLPNYYRVKVFEEDKLIDSAPAYILSGGWIKGISPDNKRLYISKDFSKTKKDLIAHQSKLDSLGIDDQRFWVQYRNFDNFNISGDHFSLETLVKNNSAEGGIDYNDIEIKLIGETGNIEIFFIRTGLTVWTKDVFSDVVLDGKTQDLKAFGQDFTNWRNVKLNVENKKVTIYFENKKIYSTSYNQSIGKIKGIIYNFRGFGAVNYLKLWNQKPKLVYDYKF